MAKDIKKPTTPAGPQAQVLHDPIVLWWEKWRKTILTSAALLVVVFLAVNIYGRIQRSGEAAETEKIAQVVSATSVDEAVNQADQIGSREGRITAKLAAFQKAVMSFDGDLLSGKDQLEKAIQIADSVGEAGTLWAKLVNDGFKALTGVDSPSPLARVKAVLAADRLTQGLEDPTLDGAPRVVVTVALDGGEKLELEFAVFSEQAPEVAAAFLEEVKNGSFDNLYWYAGNAGGASILRFGDARADATVEQAYLPSRSNWGNGPNLRPLAWVPSGLSAEAGRILAYVDNASGLPSAREIAVFDAPIESTATVSNMAHIVFGQLVLASGEDVATKLEKLTTQTKATEEGAFRPFILRARAKEEAPKGS